MQFKHIRLIIIVLVLFSISAACTLPFTTNKYLGEEFSSSIGGFSMKKAEGYSFEEGFGMVSMVSPEGDYEEGPVILILAGKVDQDIDVETLMASISSELSSIQPNKISSLKVGGVKGQVAEVTVSADDMNAQGKVFVAVPFPRQQFLFIAIATEEKWDDFEKIADAVLGSVEFFEAEDTLLDN
jgi:hypothetical protein